MALKNTAHAYGLIAKSLHWFTAFVILGLLAVGFYMVSIDFSPFKLELYSLHKSFGLLILALVFIRFGWRFLNPPPEELPTHATWERALSHIVHYGLYLAIALMPITGWIMSSAGEFPVTFFGLFDVPGLTGKDQVLFERMRTAHDILGLVIIALVGLHMAGALKHHIIDRDTTLKRMTNARLGLISGFVFVSLFGLALVTPPALYYGPQFLKMQGQEEPATATTEATVHEPTQIQDNAHAWDIDYSASAITFEATQYGQPFQGRFERFQGDITFDPQNLAQNLADIKIDITSIKTGSADRDTQALSEEWFHTSEFPMAQFIARNFESVAPNRYRADAALTIRGVTQTLDFPFSLDITENEDGSKYAAMSTEITLDRIDYGVGQGQWSTGEAIGKQIKIAITLEARQR